MAAICCISASLGGASGWGGTVSDLAGSPMSLTRSSKPAGDKRNNNLAGPESTCPARTTVSAIAEKAGVQRHTYYAHFPELKDLYQACTAHYLERNPLPDPSRWAEISDPEERLRRALSEVYAYYGGNEAMLTNVLRDTPLDPVLQENNVLLFRHWEAMRDTIADAFEASGDRHEALLAAIALTLDLQTWRTLVRQHGLDDDRAVELMIGMVRCLMRT
jgi:AcrR family transcriptional regulator